jgi:lysophospholipase L1-like esterase
MHGDAASPRRGRWRRRLLASGGSLLLALLALEVAARIRFGTPLAERLPILTIEANERSGWRMQPGVEHYTYLNPVRVNALGLRGPELGPKAPDERRVLALGDSLIYGQGVADDQTVPAHLEALLNARTAGGRWTVVNGGHRAFDTRQELGLLADLTPVVQPDVVIVFWFWNDIRERDVAGTQARLSASGPIAFDTGEEMQGGAVWRWRLMQLARRSALLMTAHDLWQARNEMPPADWEVDAALERWDGYVERFQAAAQRDGFELLIAVVPDANALSERSGGPHFSAEMSARAQEVARARGAVVCELEDALSDLAHAEGRLPVLPYDGHYTGDANRAIAVAVARCLSVR